MCPLIESNWFCHLFECWKYNNPGFIGGLKFKLFQGLTAPVDFPAAESAAYWFEISPRIFQRHGNMSVSVLHMLGLKGRIFGCLTHIAGTAFFVKVLRQWCICATTFCYYYYGLILWRKWNYDYVQKNHRLKTFIFCGI